MDSGRRVWRQSSQRRERERRIECGSSSPSTPRFAWTTPTPTRSANPNPNPNQYAQGWANPKPEPNPNPDQYTLLHGLAQHNHPALIALLLEKAAHEKGRKAQCVDAVDKWHPNPDPNPS